VIKSFGGFSGDDELLAGGADPLPSGDLDDPDAVSLEEEVPPYRFDDSGESEGDDRLEADEPEATVFNRAW
jgi:hypothetical protein